MKPGTVLATRCNTMSEDGEVHTQTVCKFDPESRLTSGEPTELVEHRRISPF
jgi:hypothetical protein